MVGVGQGRIRRIRHLNFLHFAAGRQALDHFQFYQHILAELSRSLSTAPGKAADIVNQQTEQLRLARQEIRRLGPDLLGLEARVLVERAETFDSYRLIRMTFPNRSPRELRELGKLLQKEPGVIAVLAGYDGYELSLVVNCAADSGVSAK